MSPPIPQAPPPHLIRALTNFGLTPNETVIYLAALREEETSPYALARLTRIPRTSVYDLLMSLSLKGLVTLKQSDGFTKQQTKIQAKDPSTLRRLIRQRRQDLLDTELDILSILPELQDGYHTHAQSAHFQFLPGIDGVKRTYLHRPLTTEPIMVWENMMPMDVFGSLEMNRYTETETRANQAARIHHRELIPLTDWTQHVLTYQYARNPDYIQARQMRYIDNPIFDNHLTISVQGKRITVSCAHQDEVYGLIITSQTLAHTLKALFELQWQTAVPVTPEFVRSLGPNQFYLQETRRSRPPAET